MSGNRPLSALATLALLAAQAAAQAVATIPPLSASGDPDRTSVDIPLTAPSGPVAAAVVEFGAPVPSEAVRSVTIYLRSRGGWLAAPLSAERAHVTVRLPFGAFSPESDAGPAAEADLMRISLWRRAPNSDTPSIPVLSVGLAPPAPIAVVRATDATAPGETGFAAQMAARLERILSRAGLEYDTIPDTSLDRGSGAAPPVVVLLPYAPRLSAAHIASLRAHVAAGGRVIAFYNGSPELSALLDLAPPRYKHSAPGWTVMDWNGRRIPHHTEHLHVPTVKNARETSVLATWLDAKGAATGLPAVAVTRHGALFAHIPPLAYPAAQDLFRALIAPPREGDAPSPSTMPPSLRENAPSPSTMPPSLRGDAPEGQGGVASLSAPPLSAFPIVGAWVQAPRLPATIPPSLNTLYAFLSAVPPASGSRSAVSSGSASGSRSADSSAACTAASAAVHVWLPLLNPVDRPNSRWLDPANPEDRSAALRRVRAAALRHPAGIHFDYLRTTGNGTASPEAAAAVTALLREAAALARDIAPSITLSAAVFPTPASAAEHNQDWPAWLREGLIDYAVPMLYADDPATFRAMLSECLAAAPAEKLVAGIGTGADEAQVDAAAFAAQLEASAAAHLRGVAFFPLDDALLELLASP